jgi:hypothetical protein
LSTRQYTVTLLAPLFRTFRATCAHAERSHDPLGARKVTPGHEAWCPVQIRKAGPLSDRVAFASVATTPPKSKLPLKSRSTWSAAADVVAAAHAARAATQFRIQSVFILFLGRIPDDSKRGYWQMNARGIDPVY